MDNKPTPQDDALIFTDEDRPRYKLPADHASILTQPDIYEPRPEPQSYKLPPDHAATLNTTEAADRLGVTPMTVSRLWREGYLQGYKLTPGKRNSPLRIYVESIQLLLTERHLKSIQRLLTEDNSNPADILLAEQDK